MQYLWPWAVAVIDRCRSAKPVMNFVAYCYFKCSAWTWVNVTQNGCFSWHPFLFSKLVFWFANLPKEFILPAYFNRFYYQIKLWIYEPGNSFEMVVVKNLVAICLVHFGVNASVIELYYFLSKTHGIITVQKSPCNSFSLFWSLNA